MPNQEQSSLSINILKYAKRCVSWGAIANLENIIQTTRQLIFSSRLTDYGKMLYFLSIFGNLDHVETGVSEEGINSLKTLPKSSKLLWRVKALIIN